MLALTSEVKSSNLLPDIRIHFIETYRVDCGFFRTGRERGKTKQTPRNRETLRKFWLRPRTAGSIYRILVYAEPSTGCGEKTQRKEQIGLVASPPCSTSGQELRNLVNHSSVFK